MLKTVQHLHEIDDVNTVNLKTAGLTNYYELPKTISDAQYK